MAVGEHADQPSAPRLGRRSLLGVGAAAGAGSVALGAHLVAPDRAAAQSEPDASLQPDTSLPLGYVNVKADPFGAVGDGATDDTAAVAAAYAAAERDSRPLYFPPGFYVLTSLPELALGTVLFGAGPELSVLVYDGDDTLLTLHDAQRIAFRALGFQLTGASGTLVDLSGCFNCSFDTVSLNGTNQPDAPQVDQTGVVLRDNTGGTSFVACRINNFGRGLVTSCIQNYLCNCKFSTNYVSILGTGNDANAGLSLSNCEFVNANDAHIRIDGKANDWWLSGVWFEGSKKALSVGRSGVGGPSQFGMVNCKVAAGEIMIELLHCRQPYLANVVFATDFATDPDNNAVPLTIDAENVPEGVAINLITTHGDYYDIPLNTFPPGWSVLGRATAVMPGEGPVVRSPDGKPWQITVNNDGTVSATRHS